MKIEKNEVRVSSPRLLQNERNPVGRPIQGEEPADQHVHLKCQASERRAWMRAARGMPLGKWIKGVLNGAAGKKD